MTHKIIDGLRQAVDGEFAAITIDGKRYVSEAELAATKTALAEAESKLEDAESHIEELQLEAETVAEEFERDCWKVMRRLLVECHYEWPNGEGVSADDAYVHIKACLDEQKAGENRSRDRATKAETLIVKLRAALIPFAAYVSHCSNQDDDDLHIELLHPDRARSAFVTVGNFRQCRTALSQAEG